MAVAKSQLFRSVIPRFMALLCTCTSSGIISSAGSVFFHSPRSTLPSFLTILTIAVFFAEVRHNAVVDAAFKGMRPAVVALIVVPTLSLARGMHPALIGVVILSALAVWWFGFSPIYLLVAGAAAGILWATRIRKEVRR